MADGFALDADDGAFGADKAVGVDLHLDAAIAEDAFGHDSNHIHPVNRLADDEGGGFVIGIGGASADGGDKGPPALHQIAVPVRPVIAPVERDRRAALFDGVLDDCQRVKTHQRAAVAGIAVAISTCSPRPLAPYGPWASGTSTRIDSMGGMSPMVGIR